MPIALEYDGVVSMKAGALPPELEMGSFAFGFFEIPSMADDVEHPTPWNVLTGLIISWPHFSGLRYMYFL
jgi:hypothetical protein